MFCVDTALEDNHESLEGLARVIAHDIFTIHINCLFILLVEGQKTLAEREDRSGGLCLHLESRLLNHEISKNGHKIGMKLNLNVGAQVFHEGGKRSKCSVSDS